MARKVLTQREQIVEYIKKHGSITRLDSSLDLFIFEMPARICELQKMGWIFKKTREKRTNANGITKSFTCYSIIKEGESI